MALCSHGRLGLSVEPSAMSPTLQLSTFIKRLQTPLLTHWQDCGGCWATHGACPLVQQSFYERCVMNVPFECRCECSFEIDMPRMHDQFCVINTVSGARSRTEGSVTGARLHLLRLRRHFWQGFSHSIYIKKLYIYLNVSLLWLVPLVVNC